MNSAIAENGRMLNHKKQETGKVRNSKKRVKRTRRVDGVFRFWKTMMVKEEAEKPSDGRLMMKEPYLSEIEDSKRCEATEVRACLIQC
jgi:hypothetical protein